MTLTFSSSILSTRFFQPLLSAFNSPSVTPFRRACPSFPDDHWLQVGCLRVLQDFSSGRAFLQHLSATDPDAPSRSLFFESLKSSRRLGLATATNDVLCQALTQRLPDPLAAFPELAGWHLFAGDGHFHAAAAHDPRDSRSGSKYATGHFFGLCLRSHALFHLATADQAARKHEHDLRALKRLSIAQLRRGARKRQHVLWIWDRAALDFRFWQSLKSQAGIYFLSRDKANTKLDVVGEKVFERSLSLNTGVLADELVGSSNGVLLRRVRYLDALTGEEYAFLTNEMTLPPGLIAQLYRLRWDIEKVFDELKTKLGEGKAWATSAEAKSAQAQFACLTHNLLLWLEHDLDQSENLRNEAEIARRAARLRRAALELKDLPADAKNARRRPRSVPTTVLLCQRLTQRSVKFIRWLRSYLFSALSWPSLLAPLRRIYATL